MQPRKPGNSWLLPFSSSQPEAVCKFYNNIKWKSIRLLFYFPIFCDGAISLSIYWAVLPRNPNRHPGKLTLSEESSGAYGITSYLGHRVQQLLPARGWVEICWNWRTQLLLMVSQRRIWQTGCVYFFTFLPDIVAAAIASVEERFVKDKTGSSGKVFRDKNDIWMGRKLFRWNRFNLELLHHVGTWDGFKTDKNFVGKAGIGRFDNIITFF